MSYLSLNRPQPKLAGEPLAISALCVRALPRGVVRARRASADAREPGSGALARLAQWLRAGR
ncbi:MAG: hypothetical protein QNI87_10950 [Erythrobacter sp.]|uniref:hypothetical protein n=1 Tax=Erythrobacter sp. TaxID=1042 RepID=UPI0026041BFA|nr:hypothetical protein [Erythrobacter sp.]MDJ0979038.1 hypothetical protein [Erythrobacter sp.]